MEGFSTVELCAHLSSLRCEQLHRALRQLVQRLMLHPLNQQWFNVPVDAEGLGLPDYHDLIAEPMDLGTIKSRLASFQYSDVSSFARDVRLCAEFGIIGSGVLTKLQNSLARSNRSRFG